MTINRGAFGKSLWPGIFAWYGEEYAEHPEEYNELFEHETSEKAFEELVGYSGFGMASQINEGESVVYDDAFQGFVTRVNHLKFGLGFTITSEMIEDDQYMIVAKKKAKALAFSMRQTKETNAANVYNRAFNSSYTFGDGQQILSTAHPNIAGGTFSNKLSVDADLSEAALEQAVLDIMKYTNDRGLKIQVNPEALILPVDLYAEVDRILKSPLQPYSMENNINVLKYQGRFEKVVLNHYLTDTDAWFIRTNVQNGMTYFERSPEQFKDDSDFDSDNLKYKATARYSFTIGDPRGLYGSQGA